MRKWKWMRKGGLMRNRLTARKRIENGEWRMKIRNPPNSPPVQHPLPSLSTKDDEASAETEIGLPRPTPFSLISYTTTKLPKWTRIKLGIIYEKLINPSKTTCLRAAREDQNFPTCIAPKLEPNLNLYREERTVEKI